MPKILTLLSIVAVIPGALAFAAPASATEIVADMCSDVDYQVAAGTTIRFSFVNPCQLREYSGADPDSPNAGAPSPGFSGIPNSRGATGDLFVSITAGDQLGVIKSRDRSLGQAYRQVVFGCDYTYTGTGPLVRLGCGDDQTPPPILQAVPVPASDNCSDVQDRDLSWGTEANGGWSKSWAEWANGGRGGSVCVRTLAYSSNSGGWIVQR